MAHTKAIALSMCTCLGDDHQLSWYDVWDFSNEGVAGSGGTSSPTSVLSLLLLLLALLLLSSSLIRHIEMEASLSGGSTPSRTPFAHVLRCPALRTRCRGVAPTRQGGETPTILRFLHTLRFEVFRGAPPALDPSCRLGHCGWACVMPAGLVTIFQPLLYAVESSAPADLRQTRWRHRKVRARDTGGLDLRALVAAGCLFLLSHRIEKTHAVRAADVRQERIDVGALDQRIGGALQLFERLDSAAGEAELREIAEQYPFYAPASFYLGLLSQSRQEEEEAIGFYAATLHAGTLQTTGCGGNALLTSV